MAKARVSSIGVMPSDHYGAHGQRQHPPRVLQQLRQCNDRQGKPGQLAVDPGEQVLELRHNVNQQDCAHPCGNYQYRDRVGHGFLDPGFEPLAFFQMNRHALEQGFQGAGYFASCYQIAIQLIEVAGILTQGSGQGVAAGNVLFQRLHQFAQL